MPFDGIIERHLVPLSPLPTQTAPAGKSIAPVKAVLFDIYGTLLISASGEVGTTIDRLDRPRQIDQLLQRFKIKRSAQNLENELTAAIVHIHAQMKSKGIEYPEIVIESVWESILHWRDTEKIKAFALEYELTVNPVWPMPHLQKVLKALAAMPVLLGIISNAQFYTPLILETLAGGSLGSLGFDPDLICFSYRYQQAKPSLYLFERVAQNLAKKKVDPPNVIYIGNDMRNDILPAQKIGFTTALFAGDARSLRLREDDPSCREQTADIIITDLSQLPGLL